MAKTGENGRTEWLDRAKKEAVSGAGYTAKEISINNLQSHAYWTHAIVKLSTILALEAEAEVLERQLYRKRLGHFFDSPQNLILHL
jgi:hypothetical protein